MANMTLDDIALNFIAEAMALRPDSHLNLCQAKAQLQGKFIEIINQQRQQAVEEYKQERINQKPTEF